MNDKTTLKGFSQTKGDARPVCDNLGVDEVKVVGTVNLTPTWAEAIRLHFFAIRSVPDEKRLDQIDDTEREMLRLANGYERAMALIEKLQAEVKS